MTKQELAQIALKILGIYALIQFVQNISQAMGVFGFPSDGQFQKFIMVVSIVVPSLVLLFSGIFLIRRTDKVTSKYFPSGPIDNIDLKGSQIQAIAFSIIGVVLIVTTIPKLSHLGVNIYYLMARADELDITFELKRDTIGFCIDVLSRFILGVLLFVSGDSISNLWRKITDRIKYEANIG